MGTWFSFPLSLPQNCHFWRLYKEMGDRKSFDFSNSLHGARGWRCPEPPILLCQSKTLLHPYLTSVVLTHPTLTAGFNSHVSFLFCSTSLILNCRGEVFALNKALVCFFPFRFLRKRAWTACKVVTYLQTARMILSVVAYGESDSLE